MPTNEFVKASTVINTALGLLQREIVIPNLLWLNGFGDFAGAKDDTISIRVPGRLGSRTKKLRATGADRKIQTDTIKQTKVDVTLTDDVYNAVPITDEEMTLDIKDFGVEILNPQVRGVAEGLENGAVDCMRDATYQAVVIIDKAKVYDSFVDARKALNDENVPFGQRGAVVGSGIEAAILKDPNFKQADQAGSDSALREAIIGKIAGFTVVVSNALDDDEGYVFHKTAYAMVTRAPAIPDGASFGKSAQFQNLAMRWIKDYDFENTTDRSLVNTYVGYKHVEENDGRFVRGVQLQLGTASITVTPTTASLAVGGSTQITVKDDGGDAVASRTATYTTSDPTKATVTNTGKVTAVAAGSATITAKYQNKTATTVITVTA
ncbi:MAG: P22 phage major capsid protein family protein [Rhodococcus sp. (in: high G+C Gram-positive bacteria)]|uniref:P22 phage major capsid protein family protein n=1 Tax=Rhodococcus sp. TaxID=1831 RepID=UPI002ADAAA7B|nr:P22 phage major capsid protein family protein [Rhodococcus sp. (in: high G+C Gram-positive bacteria)]